MTTTNTLTANFLGGMVFQVASTPALQIGGEQCLADRFFPALMLGTGNAADLMLPSAARETLNRVMRDKLNGAVENLDSLTWEEDGGDLGWQGMDDAVLLIGCRAQRETQIYQAGLDQYFAETVDGPGLIDED